MEPTWRTNIVGVRLCRKNTRSFLVLDLKPMIYGELDSFVKKSYPGWYIWAIRQIRADIDSENKTA